ncbi:MAG: thiamine-phosphate kinase [Magnetococcales bacterium]|nr:thiamine-phosphate kinase [Magnetococcales bacterium]
MQNNKKDPTIATIGEFGLIQSHFAPLCSSKKDIKVGIGDDGTVLSLAPELELVVSTDTLVENIHFSSSDNPYTLAKKSLRVNLSDLAAMGATPSWYLLNIATPPTTPIAWIKEFACGLKDDGERYAITLTGGDTTSSKGGLVITITVMGQVAKNRALLRSGAEPGDRIYLSGTIGDSALGLAYHLGKLQIDNPEDAAYLLNRHMLPEPRVDLGLQLVEAGIGCGAIDISDGLRADLQHICTASKVGAEVDFEKIPLSAAAKRQIEHYGDEVIKQIITGGEDYELLFTYGGDVEKIATIAQRVGVAVTDIGVITAGEGVDINRGGEPVELGFGGWTHF